MIEIERKFLVDLTKLHDTKPEYTKIQITQGYLNQDPDRTVRIRLAGDEAFITVKGKSSANGLSRYEWEQQILSFNAKNILKLCTGVIEKNRYVIQYEGKTWEVDVFHGDNEGLVVAEIELTSETEVFNIPAWVTEEVTGDLKYYNSNLIQHPFKDW